jgi:hypothetical protein
MRGLYKEDGGQLSAFGVRPFEFTGEAEQRQNPQPVRKITKKGRPFSRTAEDLEHQRDKLV